MIVRTGNLFTAHYSKIPRPLASLYSPEDRYMPPPVSPTGLPTLAPPEPARRGLFVRSRWLWIGLLGVGCTIGGALLSSQLWPSHPKFSAHNEARRAGRCLSAGRDSQRRTNTRPRTDQPAHPRGPVRDRPFPLPSRNGAEPPQPPWTLWIFVLPCVWKGWAIGTKPSLHFGPSLVGTQTASPPLPPPWDRPASCCCVAARQRPDRCSQPSCCVPHAWRMRTPPCWRTLRIC